MQRIHMKFLGLGASLESDWDELVHVLRKDFWSFLSNERAEQEFKLKIIKTGQRPHFPSLRSSRQSQNAVSYDLNKERFCDYYGQAYVHINFSTNEATLYSENFDRAHEIAYLLILSRVGKLLDLKGFHKLHAFSIEFQGKALVCMMPSKGGKSSLLMELLKDPRVRMISDDIPLVDSQGMIHAFPLKLGLNEVPEHFPVADRDENIYEMKRTLHGTKKLICTKGIAERVVSADAFYQDIILVDAGRFNSEESALSDQSWGSSFLALFKHGVVGLGTPMVLEYFWESGVEDFITKTRIFFYRLKAFLSLSLKAQKIRLDLGRDVPFAAKALLDYMEHRR